MLYSLKRLLLLLFVSHGFLKPPLNKSNLCLTKRKTLSLGSQFVSVSWKPLSLHRNRETEILKGQIDFLNDAINREEERAKELEMKSK